MEKLRSRLYFTACIFTTLSVAFALLSTGKQRDFFYIAVYAGIIGLILERKNIILTCSSIAWPVISLGLVKVLWYVWFQHGDNFNSYSDYFNGGKKLILGGILIYYLIHCNYYLEKFNYRKWLVYTMGLALICASCYALWQVSHDAGRATMATNRATISAYIYSALSLFFIYLLYIQKRTLCYFLAALTIILSFMIIILTGTRAVIILHLLITLLLTAYHFNKIHIKNMAVVLIIIGIASSTLYNKYIHPKIEQTYSEIASYQEGQDNTSLGARFSMWTVGIENFIHAPFSQSQASRIEFSQKYIERHPESRTALMFINVHLHNELIETLSLQGIIGGITLFWFYIVTGWLSLKKKNIPLFFTLVCMLVYGLTDVLLLSSEAILFYIALIGICGSSFTNKENKI